MPVRRELTDAQWRTEVRRFELELKKMAKRVRSEAMRRQRERDMRANLRDSLGVYFVKTYTVHAHFRRARA